MPKQTQAKTFRSDDEYFAYDAQYGFAANTKPYDVAIAGKTLIVQASGPAQAIVAALKKDVTCRQMSMSAYAKRKAAWRATGNETPLLEEPEEGEEEI